MWPLTGVFHEISRRDLRAPHNWEHHRKNARAPRSPAQEAFLHQDVVETFAVLSAVLDFVPHEFRQSADILQAETTAIERFPSQLGMGLFLRLSELSFQAGNGGLALLEGENRVLSRRHVVS